MSLALTRQEPSLQRIVRAFVQKHLKPLAPQIEAGEFFPSGFFAPSGEIGY